MGGYLKSLKGAKREKGAWLIGQFTQLNLGFDSSTIATRSLSLPDDHFVLFIRP